jgi:hypothetical protein
MSEPHMRQGPSPKNISSRQKIPTGKNLSSLPEYSLHRKEDHVPSPKIHGPDQFNIKKL